MCLYYGVQPADTAGSLMVSRPAAPADWRPTKSAYHEGMLTFWLASLGDKSIDRLMGAIEARIRLEVSGQPPSYQYKVPLALNTAPHSCGEARKVMVWNDMEYSPMGNQTTKAPSQ